MFALYPSPAQTGIAGMGDQLPGTRASRYERHRPEQTLLYQIVDKHYPDLIAQPTLSSTIRPSLAAKRQRYRQAGGTYGWE
jgi:hypothetical protein